MYSHVNPPPRSCVQNDDGPTLKSRARHTVSARTIDQPQINISIQPSIAAVNMMCRLQYLWLPGGRQTIDVCVCVFGGSHVAHSRTWNTRPDHVNEHGRPAIPVLLVVLSDKHLLPCSAAVGPLCSLPESQPHNMSYLSSLSWTKHVSFWCAYLLITQMFRDRQDTAVKRTWKICSGWSLLDSDL